MSVNISMVPAGPSHLYKKGRKQKTLHLVISCTLLVKSRKERGKEINFSINSTFQRGRCDSVSQLDKDTAKHSTKPRSRKTETADMAAMQSDSGLC